MAVTLHWRHNDHDGVSNHQPHCYLLNRLFGRRSKKTSKLRVTGLCAGNSPGPVNSPRKGQWRGKCFHLMTSSWICLTESSRQQVGIGSGNGTEHNTRICLNQWWHLHIKMRVFIFNNVLKSILGFFCKILFSRTSTGVMRNTLS